MSKSTSPVDDAHDQAAAPQPATPGAGDHVLTRLRARLGGSVRVQPGYDLAAPTGEVWDAAG